MAFGFYHSLVSIPAELQEAAPYAPAKGIEARVEKTSAWHVSSPALPWAVLARTGLASRSRPHQLRATPAQ